MNVVTFVYAPRSGPRWIGSAHPRHSALVPAVIWTNESAHVIGRHIFVPAASPGRWWRNEARKVAEAIALEMGGVAWDAQGDVNLVVPEVGAETALLGMWGADPTHPIGHYLLGSALRRDYPEARALLQALGSDGIQALVRAWLPRVFDGEPEPWRYSLLEEGERTILYFSRQADEPPIRVTAPWRLAAVYAARPAAWEEEQPQEAGGELELVES